VLRIYGKRGKAREVAIHAKLRPDLEQWLTERGAWPGAGTSPALFLNTKGGRLSVRTDSSVIAAIADDGGLDVETTAHVLRHTFATTLVRGGTDLVWSPNSWAMPASRPLANAACHLGRQGGRAQPAHH
jgi:integrase/recombinase XerC